MEISIDKLLQIIGSQQVELMMLRAELEGVRKTQANGAAHNMSASPPSQQPMVS